MDEAVTPRGYYRTGFQVALLQLCCFCLYFPYWLIRSRSAANRRLGREATPWYFWLMLVVPVVFLYPIFSTLSLLQKSCAAQSPRINFVLLGIVIGIFGTCYRYPDTYSMLPFLTIIPLGIMQQYSYSADVSLAMPRIEQTHFHVVEKAIVVIGGVLSLLGFVAAFLNANADPNYSPVPGVIVVIADAAALIAFWQASARSPSRVSEKHNSATN